jgi:hypothetical protein
MIEVKAYKCEICGRISEEERVIKECEKNIPFQYAKSGDICKVKALGLEEDATYIIRFKDVFQRGHDIYYNTENIFKYKANWFKENNISSNDDFERLFIDLELLGNENEGFNIKEYIKNLL